MLLHAKNLAGIVLLTAVLSASAGAMAVSIFGSIFSTAGFITACLMLVIVVIVVVLYASMFVRVEPKTPEIIVDDKVCNPKY